MPRYVPVLVIGVILGALVVSAQVSTGTISGIVQDQSGAVIAGATVTIRDVDTGAVRTLTSDAGGRYLAPVLPVGNYEVQAQQSGFQTEVRSGIDLTVGREEVVNLALKVGQLSDKVTITAEAPLVESTTSAMNHANFYEPTFNVFSGSAGHITKLISSPGGRLTQLGLKVIF